MDSQQNLSLYRLVSRIDQVYGRLTNYSLVVCTMIVLLLSVLVIVLRWFNTTLFWYDPLVRHLVFLLAFLGGIKASAMGTHISIDLLSRNLQNSLHVGWAKAHKIFLALVSIIILAWLIYAGVAFTQIEFAYGRAVFFNIHSAYLVAIIPVGFGLIAFQFLLVLLKELLAPAVKKEAP